MKIYPINNIKYNLQAGVQPSLSPVNAEDVRNMTELSGIYMPVISFCGDYEEFKRQMLSLDNIHCPGCGNKMLSEKKLKQIVNNAAYTKTIPEYAKFLEKNKEYFHPQYQPFIAYVNRFAQNTPEKSIQDMLNVMSKGSSVLMNKQFVKDADYLQKQLERKQFSPSDKEKINECINYFRTLEKIPKYSDLKEHLLNTLGSLDSEQKWELYNKIKKNFQKIYTYNFVLKNRDINTAGLPEHAAVTYNILLNSKSSLASVYQNPAKEKRFNKFLLCDNCAASYKSFSAITSKPDAKEKLELYSNDIADAIAQRKLAGNNLYLYEFFRTVRGFTKNRISLDRGQICSEAKNTIFNEEKSQYIFSGYSGIPCACCGTNMLTHEEKEDIYRQIIKSDGLFELRNVAKVNEKYISRRYNGIIDRYNKILEKYPEITEKEMVQLLQKLTKRDLKQQIEKNKNEVLKYQARCRLNYLDKEYLNDYVYRVNKKYKNLENESEFRFDDYKKLLKQTLENINNPAREKFIELAKQDIQHLYILNRLVNPLPHVAEKTGGELKAIFENIFKGSVITVDHIQSRYEAGADEYYNKIGYCRDCNREKTNMTFEEWIKVHPEIRKNLPRHLQKISEIIKKEKIKSMYDYPEKVARFTMKLANGKLKIPAKYDTKG